MKIYPRHLREMGYCVRGSREFAARHGIDWREFIRDGVEADILMATGDAMAKRAVEWAEKTKQSQ